MSVNATNLIMGAGTLYTAAFGATEPATITTAPDSATWTDAGATTNGVEMHWTNTWAILEVDQIPEHVGRRMTNQEYTLVTNLAEPTLNNLSIVLNAAAPVAGTNTLTYEPVEGVAAFNPVFHAVIFDGLAPAGKRRRITARKVLNTDNVDVAYKKDAQTVFNVTFAAHYVSPTIKSISVVDDTTVTP